MKLTPTLPATHTRLASGDVEMCLEGVVGERDGFGFSRSIITQRRVPAVCARRDEQDCAQATKCERFKV